MNNLFDQFLKKFIRDCRLKVVFGGVFWSFFTFFQKFSRANPCCPLERSVKFCAKKIALLLENTALNFFKIGHFWLIFLYK